MFKVWNCFLEHLQFMVPMLSTDIMTSKSPFTSQGITGYAKFGQTPKKAAGTNDYIDYGVVWPKHLINMLQVK
jgi:hypothetical protein